MKIIIANKYYYPRGGDCIYSIELQKLLERNGHDIAIYAMQHSENISSKYSKYFPSEVNYEEKRIQNVVRQIMRPLYSREVKKSFEKLLREYKPDLLHVNNIHSQISPLICKVAYERNIPIVWTLHDYKLFCSRYDHMRNGRLCELCIDKPGNVIRFKCMKNNTLVSTLAYLEQKIWALNKIEKYITFFICPSEFMYNKLIKAGISKNKIKKINNFIQVQQSNEKTISTEEYYCYVGRITKEKGIETLLKAAQNIPEYRLKVIGTGPDYEELRKKYSATHIDYYGRIDNISVRKILENAKFMVIPSECYENNPLSIIESLCVGTPVLGANIGGIPELIEQGNNGEIFEPFNLKQLENKIRFMWNKYLKNNQAQSIMEKAVNKYSDAHYYTELYEIYKKAIII